MRVYDVVVVGAGPAGLAAATEAANAGRSVALLDDNLQTGGQIWRADARMRVVDRARERAIARFETCGAVFFAGHQVVDVNATLRVLQAWLAAEQRVEEFRFQSLVLATGARERMLPFPGWTLPGVLGAGGLQALVRGGYEVRGKRVVVAGTGPLLLAVAAHLKQDGAEIVTIVEQAAMRRLARFAAGLVARPVKVIDAMRLRAELDSVPYRMGCWVVAAEGGDRVRSVRLSDGANEWTEPCDLLACGFHLVPNTELASLLGCRVTESGVEVDAEQQTSVKGVYCAGEPTGVAGVEAAIVQGRIAGLAAAGQAARARALCGRRDAEAEFGRAMSRAFALRAEVLKLAAPDTIVCRCEDVRLRELQQEIMPYRDWTEAKLQTRCGMGACQGRVCRPALEAMFGWRNASVRPPVFPVPVAALCCASPIDSQTSKFAAQEDSR